MNENLNAARNDFNRARQQAVMAAILARISGRSVDLLSFDDVRRRLRASEVTSRGVQDIPIDAIVGTVNRTVDFTRDFLPLQPSDEERWARVRSVTEDPGFTGMPPIEVYKIGEAFFVRDGHHRVSVARTLGQTQIQAYVTEVLTDVPFAPDTQPDELLHKAEYAEFLERTHLSISRPGIDLSVSVAGQYERLLTYIDVQRYVMSERSGRAVDIEDAAAAWVDEAYQPIVTIIRDMGLLRDHPDRTETDLYIWIVDHTEDLRRELGWKVSASALAGALAEGFKIEPQTQLGGRILRAVVPSGLQSGPAPGVWRRSRLEQRYLDRLFPDILVPISGGVTSWQALDQALDVARREQATLFGLHVVTGESARTGAEALAVQEGFERRCVEAGVEGRLAIEAGDLTDKICERATLVDLVILNLAHPPGAGVADRLTSGFSAVIRRSPRPVLAVPAVRLDTTSALVAFDGSPKSKEALFVAAYLAGSWSLDLIVVSIREGGVGEDAQRFARDYLEFHELTADYVVQDGATAEAVLHLGRERNVGLYVLGGYGAHPAIEVMVGSAVDRVLRETDRPVLICR
ncbi:MAG: universal stress protein [Anaerolineales bacterium]|nr:universal stress protein [Anaerolineales bacterium]